MFKNRLKSALVIACVGALTACATNNSTTQPNVQVTFVQACGAYESAFGVAVQLRINGQLSPAAIKDISIIDSQVTPICTGPMPADSNTAVAQITTAIASLTAAAVIAKESK